MQPLHRLPATVLHDEGPCGQHVQRQGYHQPPRGAKGMKSVAAAAARKNGTERYSSEGPKSLLRSDSVRQAADEAVRIQVALKKTRAVRDGRMAVRAFFS